jgi:hypothetical protein
MIVCIIACFSTFGYGEKKKAPCIAGGLGGGVIFLQFINDTV